MLFSPKYYGKNVGGYTIEKAVGKGRYGVCFLAVSDCGDHVIIKKFRNSMLNRQSDKNAYEAVILSQLNDSRIPKLLGVVNQKIFYGFVLELMPGKTAKDLLFNQGRRFSKDEFYKIGLRLIDIVKYLHENGIVHRDIRISNVLIDGDNVNLVDFGLARYVDGIAYKYDLDFSYLGDFFLYLLYSTFNTDKKSSNTPWHEELPLTHAQKRFLKKLLGLEPVYTCITEVETDFIDSFGTLSQ